MQAECKCGSNATAGAVAGAAAGQQRPRAACPMQGRDTTPQSRAPASGGGQHATAGALAGAAAGAAAEGRATYEGEDTTQE
eukprot:5091998-Alexandrium_andersonii.AAC.1